MRLLHTSRLPRRTLFTLPKFPSQAGIETQTYSEQKVLPYTRQQLYQVVADVKSYPRFVPYCTGSRILRTPPVPTTNDQVIMDAELTVGFLTFKESYVSKVTCTPFDSVEAVASSSTHLFKTLSTTWRFKPASYSPTHKVHSHGPDNIRPASSMNSPTMVTLDLTFAFESPIHATVSAAFFGQVSKLMVKAFEKRCSEVYGGKTETK